jgi:membrane protease YdiL (CAAX protease family)
MDCALKLIAGQERQDMASRDFPYYNDLPTRITGHHWGWILIAVAMGFGALIAPIPLFATTAGQFIPAILFFAIPLAAFGYMVPRDWTAIFDRVGVRDVGWMVVFGLLNVAVTIAIGFVVMKLHGAQTNPVFGMMAGQDVASRVLFFLKTLPQLFGEELITILPMLALMTFVYRRLKWGRTTAIVVAWLGSAALFAAMHLPTYQWDFVQCFVVIGSARLILSLAYLRTKNIWVSTGAHVLNDWILFGVALLGAVNTGVR